MNYIIAIGRSYRKEQMTCVTPMTGTICFQDTESYSGPATYVALCTLTYLAGDVSTIDPSIIVCVTRERNATENFDWVYSLLRASPPSSSCPVGVVVRRFLVCVLGVKFSGLSRIVRAFLHDFVFQISVFCIQPTSPLPH